MSRIIAIANQKGGVGKTTTCINMCAVLKSRGKRVLICDLDPQGNCTSGMGVDKSSQPNVYDVLMNGADIKVAIISTKHGDIIPSNKGLSGATVELVEKEQREYILKKQLDKVRDNYDYIFIDCPPSLEMLTLNGLVAADSILIPVQCEYFALEGLSDLLTTIKMINRRLNPKLDIDGVVLTMYDSRVRLANDVSAEIEKFFNNKVYKSRIPRNVRLSEAPSHGKPIIEYDRMSKGARAYYKLTSEFLAREREKGGR